MTSLNDKQLFLSLLFVFPIIVIATDLELLIKPQIEDAKCSAKCLNVPMEEKSLCFEICKLTQENPKTDICKFPKFCTGGCETACRNVAENEAQSKFNFYSVSKCSLSWRMSADTRQNVVFVLAGQDQGGMWNIVSSRLKTNSIAWADRGVDKYISLSILAVGEGEILDKLEIVLPRLAGKVCEEVKDELELSPGNPLLATVLTCSLLALSLCILGCSLAMARRGKHMTQAQSTEYLVCNVVVK